MKRAIRDEKGYAVVLTLLFMPVFIGISLMVIDLGRGNNAHSDLQAAADALALAGAVELDGNAGAIENAKDAMLELTNSVSFLGLDDISIDLVYADEDANEFNVIFLKDIPEYDHEPIDQEFVDNNGTIKDAEAKYVFVQARSIDLDPMFPVPVTYTTNSVPILAEAVAGRKASACGVTPLFICNPFESELTDDLETSFKDGKLHGRIINAHPAGNATAGPGNFGYLDIPDDDNGGGANKLKEFFATDKVPACFDAEIVDTEPGAKIAVGRAINTRFDLWGPGFKNDITKTPAAANVRKGFVPTEQEAEREVTEEVCTVPGDQSTCSTVPVTAEREVTEEVCTDPGDQSTCSTVPVTDANGDPVMETYNVMETYTFMDACAAEEALPVTESLEVPVTDANGDPVMKEVCTDPLDQSTCTDVPVTETITKIVAPPESMGLPKVNGQYITADGAPVINGDMSSPGEAIAGAFLGSGDWDINTYFKANYGLSSAPVDIPNTFPSAVYPGSQVPSRYDVYLYELSKSIPDYVDTQSPGGEVGNPACAISKKNPRPTSAKDRRLIQAAIINCDAANAAGILNGQKNIPVEAYASVFLTNPVKVSGPSNDEQDGTIGMEIVDITGETGLGTLDTYLRVEGILVR